MWRGLIMSGVGGWEEQGGKGGGCNEPEGVIGIVRKRAAAGDDSLL